MIKAIVYGYNKPDAERKYKEYCRSNNIPCRLGEAILLSSMENPVTNSERICGYYNEVMNETVADWLG